MPVYCAIMRDKWSTRARCFVKKSKCSGQTKNAKLGIRYYLGVILSLENLREHAIKQISQVLKAFSN